MPLLIPPRFFINFFQFCVLQSLLVYKSRASSIIPIINISEFYSLNHEIRKQIAAQIGDACRNVGFFVVTGYRIDTAVIDSICENCFYLSLVIKIIGLHCIPASFSVFTFQGNQQKFSSIKQMITNEVT